MANLKSAKKRAIQNKKRQRANQARRTEFKTLTKKFEEALATNDIASAKELLQLAESKIARACSKKVVKRNTAARKTSSLAKRLAGAQKKSA